MNKQDEERNTLFVELGSNYGEQSWEYHSCTAHIFEISRRSVHFFYVIDTSGSMVGDELLP